MTGPVSISTAQVKELEGAGFDRVEVALDRSSIAQALSVAESKAGRV
jgi:hypothetical protein